VARGLADWSEFDAEAEHWGVEVRGLWLEDLRALIESSTRESPTTEHRRLLQGASDFVRWGRRGDRRTLALHGQPYFSLLARLKWGRIEAETLIEYRARRWRGGSLRSASACIIVVSAYTTREGGRWRRSSDVCPN
jgi:hypothetical protein